LAAPSHDGSEAKPLRVRTITAALELSDVTELGRVEAAVKFLAQARETYQDSGYEVQTIRIATNPWAADANERERDEWLGKLHVLDELVANRGAILSIGPVLDEDRADTHLAEWASELVRTTRAINFSVVIASPEHGVHGAAASVAATRPDARGRRR
jgi:hypothetical protein